MITILADETGGNLGKAICDGLEKSIPTQRVKLFMVKDMDIKPCYACGGCEKKNYRRCVFRDDADLIFPYIAKSDVIVLATKITFGSCSYQIKRILDKFVLILEPAYGMKNGEMIRRTVNPSRVTQYVIGVHDGASAQEIGAFEQHVSEMLGILYWKGRAIITQSDSSSVDKTVESFLESIA